MGVLVGYTRERKEGREEKGDDERQWKIVVLPCYLSLTHDRSVYIKHISTLQKNNELNKVLDKLTYKLKMFII